MRFVPPLVLVVPSLLFGQLVFLLLATDQEDATIRYAAATKRGMV